MLVALLQEGQVDLHFPLTARYLLDRKLIWFFPLCSMIESDAFNFEAVEAFRAKAIPVNKAYSVALAALFLAGNRNNNGKSLTIIGDTYTEVEGPLLKLQPQWYGEYNTEMARNAASVRLDKISKE
jgi:hypothetical protein